MRLPSSAKLRRSLLKPFIVGGVGGTIGVLSLLCGVSIYLVDTLTRPKKLAPFSEYTFTPFELNLPAEAVEFPPRNGGHKVSGWFIPAPDATATIMICPGYRTSKSELLGIAGFLWKDGYNILIFEYYGHGSAVGAPVTLGYREMEDFLGAVDYAKSRAPGTRLGVVGYSMGAAVAIMCSARSSDVEALVADSAFATHTSAIDYNVRRSLHLPYAPFAWLADYLLNWRAGYRSSQVEPLRDVMHIAPRPLLIIHGGKDSLVDPHDALLLYAAAREPKELWMVPSADHCGAYFTDRPLYVKKIKAFFEQHLGGQLVVTSPTGEEAVERAQMVEREALEAATALLSDHEEQQTRLFEAS